MVTNLNLSYPQALQLLKNCRFHPGCAGKAGARGRRGAAPQGGEERSPRHHTPDTSHVLHPPRDPSSAVPTRHSCPLDTSNTGLCAPRHRSLLLPGFFFSKEAAFVRIWGNHSPQLSGKGGGGSTRTTCSGDTGHCSARTPQGSPVQPFLGTPPLSPKGGQALVLALPQASLNKQTRP